MNIRLPKVNEKRKKRLGRGMGSGKGSHTSSRGQKGQKSRSHISVLFEGMKMKKSLLKRLPLMRGKGKFRSRKGKTARYITKSKVKVVAPKASKT